MTPNNTNNSQLLSLLSLLADARKATVVPTEELFSFRKRHVLETVLTIAIITLDLRLNYYCEQARSLNAVFTVVLIQFSFLNLNTTQYDLYLYVFRFFECKESCRQVNRLFQVVLDQMK